MATYKNSVLEYIDTFQFRTQLIKIIILDKNEYPLYAIEGRATGGSININAASTTRRTGSLTLVTTPSNDDSLMAKLHEVTNIKSLLSMNKRVKIEVGIKNSGMDFQTIDTFWISLGVLLIQNASVTYNNQGITIQLKMVDKMALLNGEMGGTFSQDVIHAPNGIFDLSSGKQKIVNEQIKVYDLVESLVHKFGELQPHEYIISVPHSVKNIITWTDKRPLYKTKESLSLISSKEAMCYEQGDIIGYTMTDFVYPIESGKTLESKAGESITSVLDKIKNTLGNYEYFFDINGVFHFQEIQNYINEGSNIDNLSEAIAEKYFINSDRSLKAVYSFNDAVLITSYVNNPQYNQIKNDFSVWGKKNDKPIQYHLILQKIPQDMEKLYWKITIIDGKISTECIENSNDISNKNFITQGKGEEANQWLINFSAQDRPGRTGSHRYTDDWRLKLWLESYATDKILTPFDLEIQARLPLLFQLTLDSEESASTFFTPIYDENNLSYWLDVVDTGDLRLQNTIDITDFGIETIGRHVKTFNDDKVNCLFRSFSSSLDEFVECDDDSEFSVQASIWYVPTNYQIKDENDKGVLFWDSISIDLAENAAYDLLRAGLHEHLSYNNNINLTAIPVYHLDVNQRITVNSNESDIHGDYVINSISLPLTLDGMMTINARKAVERI